MKLVSALSVLFTFSPAAVVAPPPPGAGGGASGGFETCAEQKECVKFTASKVQPGSLCGDTCEYEICLELAYGPNCLKSGAISHECAKTDNQCHVGGDGLFTSSSATQNGDKNCQIVSAGAMAEFIVKDGNNGGSCGSDSLAVGANNFATCETYTGADSCTGNSGGMECIWRVKAPETCGKVGKSWGDPHLKLWNGTRYSYHGECDLVLLSNAAFDAGAGLDLHIRTTLEKSYSFIEAIALRVGASVLEMTGDKFWINGIEGSDEDLPVSLGGYTMRAPSVVHGKREYRIDLSDHDYVKFRSYKHFVGVEIAGRSDDFVTSVGLLGDFKTGAMLARDGRTVIEDVDTFGAEWQVRGYEPMLFRAVRAPQHPHQTCNMPVATSRRLRETEEPAVVKAAEEACAHMEPEDFELCVYDVLATGDIEMAGAW